MTPAIQPSFASLQTQINRQLESVTDGLKQGRISKQEAERFTTALSAFSRELKADAFSGDGVTRGTAIAEQLKGIGGQITSARRDSNVDAFQQLEHVEVRIRHHLAAGHLSPTEAGELRAQLANLKHHAPGKNTSAQSSAVLSQFEHHVGDLDTKLTQLATDRHIDVEKRGAWMERRISSGLKDGSLTNDEANALRNELASCRNTRGGDPEALRSRMDALSKQIYTLRRNENVNLFSRASAVEQQLNSAASSGRVNQSQLGELLSMLKLDSGLSPGLAWFIHTGDFKQADKEFGSLLNNVARRLEQLLANAAVK